MTWKIGTRYDHPAKVAKTAKVDPASENFSDFSGFSGGDPIPAEVERLALLALFPERPWTGPPYPSGTCPTCGGRHFVLLAGATAWLCSDCHPPPGDGARDTFTLSPNMPRAGP